MQLLIYMYFRFGCVWYVFGRRRVDGSLSGWGWLRKALPKSPVILSLRIWSLWKRSYYVGGVLVAFFLALGLFGGFNLSRYHATVLS